MKASAQKAFVGMSGGVDSSVSAAILKKAGYDVTGVFIKVWQADWMECNWREERIEAMRAAAHLDIPFVTLDLEKEYKEDVVDYMIAEYRAGRTPNPDVMCNTSVKFGAFYDWALAQGADFVATGHYARIAGKQGAGSKELGLLIGVDSNKDQSYFLWNLKPAQLSHILFPVGGMTKPEVRELARSLELPNADKKDSQGLCFIGKVDIREFLSHYIQPDEAGASRGKVLNEKGEAIGIHSGALFLTIGERHGFEIDAKHKTPHDAPYYVVAKDMKANTITVSNKTLGGSLGKGSSNGVRQIRISQCNWIRMVPSVGATFQARSRYRALLHSCKFLSIKKDTAVIEFTEPQYAITPGQSLVIYDGDVCIGGGTIE